MGGPGSGRRANPRRRRRVVELRAAGLTLAEIGRRVGMTREGVRQTLAVCGVPAVRSAPPATWWAAPEEEPQRPPWFGEGI
jgi:hypothetical protein